MTIVLIITTIGILLYGYLLMQRIDSFFEKHSDNQMPVATMNKDVLLYGKPKALNALCGKLGSSDISYDCVEEPALCTHTAYRWVCAFSDSDIDNLQLCKAAKREQKHIHLAAKCNDSIYEDIYKHIGVSLVLHKDIHGDNLLACIEGQEHVYNREV